MITKKTYELVFTVTSATAIRLYCWLYKQKDKKSWVFINKRVHMEFIFEMKQYHQQCSEAAVSKAIKELISAGYLKKLDMYTFEVIEK